ncbi:putative quinol monooxygenase [Pacificibacter sp. AS14]|uniref:putative quinol monooxygenase n=1 Tax=Pacificibacter sp. AS14 TaxID=3135785 RepID=UPI00317F4F83
MADVHVFAKIQPKADHYDEVLAALRDILQATQAESGCKRFELNVGEVDDKSLYLVEVWESATALEQHHKMQHTLEAAERIDGKLSASTEVVKMTPAI